MMSIAGPLTAQRVYEIVMANRAIRAPDYHADQPGRRWGADLIPALMGLFRVEKDTRDNHPNGWVGFARHWGGETFRLDFDLNSGTKGSNVILVVTMISGWEGTKTRPTIVDEGFGEFQLPDRVPSEQEWEERRKDYQAARRTDAADGSTAVRAYIAALPGWKRAVAIRIDEIVQHEVPQVRRAVKWHIPFYGIEGQGWFASFSVFSRHVKLTFLRGTSLEPAPPHGDRPEGRDLDLRETDALDETQLASWFRQAAAIPGWGS